MRNHHDKRALPILPAWKRAMDEWCLHLRASGALDSTIQKRWDHVSHLSRCLGIDDPANVGLLDVTRWAGTCEWASDTRHSYYISYSQFFEFVQGPDSVVAAGLPRVRRRDGMPRPCPDSVYYDALERATPREVVMLLLAGAMGLRACEIARVHRDDITAEGQGFVLRIFGKGGRQRLLPIPDGVDRVLIEACARGDGWAMPSQLGGHLQASSVSKGGSAVLGGGWTLHSLRHRFATKAYGVQRDILVVQRLLGHASVATTQRYAQPPAEAIRIAVDAATPREWLDQYTTDRRGQ